ncbi:hypothetical protein P152DRAFT_483197 [Eremomyces bilateralis CBS 781.70]|uniref:Uncharacterized protein n=1 Tax=Eremomyces bilateralis CBS 781.70 TaxID=1392243 RepID=A0A6G1FZM4_9PEZI|nr:uncharacterized protein P152DRAFT_483197 [Eremomyces bilateralis CBS 781.70]KAF1811315.1 hypothetical protein P152DRAFT_483197 [Eremomyces bilateralis CBS 781.70]
MSARVSRRLNSHRGVSRQTTLPPRPSPTKFANTVTVPPRSTTDDGIQTYRTRRGNNRPLPLPPSLDPLRRAARINFKQPGPDPDPEETERFHAQFVRNPYARMLASPLRLCTLTQARLPADLLAKFSIRLDPTTSEPHLLPSHLYLQSLPDEERPPRTRAAVLRSVYLSLRYDVIAFMTAKGKWKGFQELMAASTPREVTSKLRWRADMPQYIRDLLRRGVTWRMKRALESADPAILEPCPGGAFAAGDFDDVSAVVYIKPKLWSDRVKATHANLKQVPLLSKTLRGHFVERLKEMGDRLPERFRVVERPMAQISGSHSIFPPQLAEWVIFPDSWVHEVDYRGKKIPVFSLADLLGEEKARELVDGTEYADVDCVVLKNDEKTSRLHQSLVKLERYVADGI